MKVRRMGIKEVTDIEDGVQIDVSVLDGRIQCFYCSELIRGEGVVGKGSWIFHEDCYSKHAEQIARY